MTDRSSTTGDDRSPDAPAEGFRRREFVALGAGVSATMLAGCAGDGGLGPSDGADGSTDSDDSDGSQMRTGSFRLLISDAPADIADFDRLDVTLSEARIFTARDADGEEADRDEGAGNETETDTDPANESAEDGETAGEETGTTDEAGDADDENADDENADDENADDENGGDDDEDDEDDGADRGFAVVDLDGATVDLTRVIDEDAMAVFDGEIAAGEYEKVELSVSTVEGIVDGEAVEVKLPSEKLQITNGFEITPEEPVSFVFDINVVKRGQTNGYILKPVISGSGVAGRDVEVTEIDGDDEADEGDSDGEGGPDDEESNNSGDPDPENDGSGGGPEGAGDDGGDGGDESAGAQNGTATGSGD